MRQGRPSSTRASRTRLPETRPRRHRGRQGKLALGGRAYFAQALALKQADPAVTAGIYSVIAVPWLVPGGAISFQPARFPRTIAEATA
jgi:hypothetical protein